MSKIHEIMQSINELTDDIARVNFGHNIETDGYSKTVTPKEILELPVKLDLNSFGKAQIYYSRLSMKENAFSIICPHFTSLPKKDLEVLMKIKGFEGIVFHDSLNVLEIHFILKSGL